MTAIRPRRNLIDKQIAAYLSHACIRECEVQRSLYLQAELLSLPLRLTVARPAIVLLSIENLCEVCIHKLRPFFSTIFPFQNEALLLRAHAQSQQAHKCVCGFN